jgi:hypothetical protein
MRIFATPALLALSVLAFATTQTGVTPVRAQSAPVQTGQTPQQSDQSRAQDRSRAEDVKIGRDWKAQGGENDHAGRAAADKDHETVGRDWRAHPGNREH